MYTAWQDMMRRCYNEEHVKYPIYGGRGIRVCKRWRESFASFCLDMGVPEAELTLDRRDSNKNYTPSNCRWATRIEQARNMRTNRLLTLRGETRCLHDWCEHLGIPIQTVYSRLKAGWSVEQTLTPGRFHGTRRDRHARLGNREQTVAAWAREHGLNPQTVYKRLEAGETLQEALDRPAKRSRVYCFRGCQYTLAELAASVGINANTLRFRIDYAGWTVQRAICAGAPKEQT
jgi:hypothetical protein